MAVHRSLVWRNQAFNETISCDSSELARTWSRQRMEVMSYSLWSVVWKPARPDHGKDQIGMAVYHVQNTQERHKIEAQV